MDTAVLEAYTLRAWAALETELYDGWVLRAANGYTRRSNSINPIYPGALNLENKITYCEQWFISRGLTPCFKLTDAAKPPVLDTLLNQRGYVYESGASVMTIDLTHLPEHDKTLQIESTRTRIWLDHFCTMNTTNAHHYTTMQAVLDAIDPQTYFASVIADDEVVAVGLGVREDVYVGLFDIVTREDVRRQGYGRALVVGLLRQAQRDGAKIGYLQVVESNQPAVRLYEQLGFKPAYHYWYRTLRQN
jgi:ribosomal protein S18 acetylase RimI-like enzyme